MPSQRSGQTAPAPLPENVPGLLPFLPLIYVAWSDGILTTSEMEEIRHRLTEDATLESEARRILKSWLRPDAPPTASQLTELRRRIRREARQLSAAERRSLASLGVGLARQREAGPTQWSTEEGLGRLQGIEGLLGVLGDEAARDLLEEAPPTEVPESRKPPPTFDPAAMVAYLEGEHGERRTAALTQLRSPALRIPRGLERDAYRERVLDAVRQLADAGMGRIALPPEFGGEGDLSGSIVTFETLAYGDLSVLVKYGVHFGLFGGSILQLGSDVHHRRYLVPMASLDLPGCFAMTERDHGSNVRALETTARYLPESGEFEIHTPHDGAVKDWIGNAALHGRLATVFARLDTMGEDHGVHAFLVPIRDEEGRTLPGVEIEDCGDKVGLQGVDNGRITFHEVHIPRENLLNRFADVGPDGTYKSSIASDGKRFFTMLGTLVSGRISIAAASVSASKAALAIAVRFSSRRRQFGPSGKPEVSILDFLTQQRALLPRVAASYGLHFAVRDLIRDYATAKGTEERARVEAMAAGLKARASRHAQETIQICREACGGRGYLAENRFGDLRNDTDVFTTFEGANVVLLQLVARTLLTRFREEMGDLRFWGTLRFLADRAGTEVSRRNPVRSRRTGEAHLRDPEVHMDAFAFREDRLLATVARRLKGRIDEGMDSFDAMNACQDHLVELAEAHVDRRILESFQRAVADAPDGDLKGELKRLGDLWALWRLEGDRAWFLESGYMDAAQTKAIRALVNQLMGEVRQRAVALVDGFGIPEDILDAPAALAGGPPDGDPP
jgi:acyl-CoA oxidase